MSAATAEASPGALLRQARVARGLYQWQVARQARISVHYLSQLEHETAPLAPSRAAVLGPVLGIPVADLLPRAPRQRLAPPVPVPAGRRPWARSHRGIPVTCPCDWVMVFAGRKPAGWELERAKPACPHHRTEAAR